MEIEIIEDDGDWFDFLAIIEKHPEFAMRILEMGDAMQGGRLLSVYNLPREWFVEMLDESMGGGHHKGYLNEKADAFLGRNKSLASGARGRDSFKVTRIIVRKLVENLKTKWGNNNGQKRRWRV